jgi:carbon-monoxide dehydrogenase small subunit
MSDRERRTIRFTLNGRPVAADISASETVVDMMQREFGLTGARESCGQGLCGCCTVLVNDVAVSGCLYLAAFVDGAAVLTVEGLADRNKLHPIQESFISNSALQCGYCTPGFELMTKKLLERYPHPTDTQIRHYLSGNLCRCGTYPDIVEAVKSAAKTVDTENSQ